MPLVAIVGSGFAGLAAAHALRREGIDDVVLLERAPTLGGTWRDNRYPGCACDIPSYLYSFSFAPSATWTRVYAPQPEIWDYLERCADDLGLRDRIRFGRDVAACTWDEGAATWRLRTGDGDELSARFVVLATGALSNPAYPALPGLERFRGTAFHSARWDHGYDLRGKRVAVIGTGASAIQFTPRVQPLVERLYVVQRTPPWIIPRHDRAFRRWERAVLRAVPAARWLYREAIFWLLEARVVAFEHPALMRLLAIIARRHLAKAIADPTLRARLTPREVPGCKRILLSDDYYPALTRPNVELVTAPVERVEADGLVLEGGRKLVVDALLHGTGFRVHDHFGGMRVIGRGGADLGACWREHAQAYLGTTVAGFPDLFVMAGPNTGLGHNSVVVMIEGQARYAARAIRLALDRGAAVEVKREVQAAYNAWLGRRLPHTVWLSGCRSWYLDPHGRNTALWPGLAASFRARTARLRPEDFALTPAPWGGR